MALLYSQLMNSLNWNQIYQPIRVHQPVPPTSDPILNYVRSREASATHYYKYISNEEHACSIAYRLPGSSDNKKLNIRKGGRYEHVCEFFKNLEDHPFVQEDLLTRNWASVEEMLATASSTVVIPATEPEQNVQKPSSNLVTKEQLESLTCQDFADVSNAAMNRACLSTWARVKRNWETAKRESSVKRNAGELSTALDLLAFLCQLSALFVFALVVVMDHDKESDDQNKLVGEPHACQPRFDLPALVQAFLDSQLQRVKLALGIAKPLEELKPQVDAEKNPAAAEKVQEEQVQEEEFVDAEEDLGWELA